jgi:hypothetical protein
LPSSSVLWCSLRRLTTRSYSTFHKDSRGCIHVSHFPMHCLRMLPLLCKYEDFRKGRDSSVGIALGYGLDDRGSRVRLPAGAGNLSLHHNVQNGSGAHPASYLMVPGALSLGLKRPGREADHSPPSSAKVNNVWSYTSTPPVRLHFVVLI